MWIQRVQSRLFNDHEIEGESVCEIFRRVLERIRALVSTVDKEAVKKSQMARARYDIESIVVELG